MGGSSGRASSIIYNITPGIQFSLSIGHGGDSLHASDHQSREGNSGELSQITSPIQIYADGGGFGVDGINSLEYGLQYFNLGGGQGARRKVVGVSGKGVIVGENISIGGVTGEEFIITRPFECINPFTLKKILASGGFSLYMNGSSNTDYTEKAEVVSGKTTSESKNNSIPSKGTLPGCGGGGCIVDTQFSNSLPEAISAPGCDGAAYIYVVSPISMQS